MTEREPTKLGTVLRTAREARFIDLPASSGHQEPLPLPRGLTRRYRDLPFSVYTRGFRATTVSTWASTPST